MKIRIALLIGAVAWTTACGDDAVGPTSDALTQEEAEELAASMAAFGGDMVADTTSTSPSSNISAAVVPSQPAANTIDFEIGVNNTHPCPLGGEVDVQGTLDASYDQETTTFTGTLEATHTNRDCAYEARGDTVVTNGTGNITATLKKVDEAWSGEQDRTYQGEFDWAIGEDRSGRCAIDLTATLKPSVPSRSVVGTVCNHEIDMTVTITDSSA